MFSIVKLRDALNVVLEQKASFVEAAKEVLKQTSSFKGELEYPKPKPTCFGKPYASITFETSINVEKITASITMYLNSHESLERFYRLKGIKVCVPELAIEEYVDVRDLGLKEEFKIHSITHAKTSDLHIHANVSPY